MVQVIQRALKDGYVVAAGGRRTSHASILAADCHCRGGIPVLLDWQVPLCALSNAAS